MRVMLAAVAAFFLVTPALAADRIECAQIPHAQSFIDGLKPGQNTIAAQRHLDAAKQAKSDKDCVAELGKVNYYAKRSAAADKHAASAKPRRVASKRAKSRLARHVKCADSLHQDRPGGSDYRGPPVAGCKRVL